MAYKLDLPVDLKVPFIFHVSFLKPCPRLNIKTTLMLAPIMHNGKPLITLLVVVGIILSNIMMRV